MLKTAWPESYLQPDPNKDCGFYAAAYLGRCLGYPKVTAEEIKDWRARTRKHETQYAKDVLGAEMRTFWDYGKGLNLNAPDLLHHGQQVFWLGQDYKVKIWVRLWLHQGWIAHLMVHRVQPMAHAVVLLEADENCALIMDPIYGLITEPWEWLLGPGPEENLSDWRRAPDGREFYGCSFIEGWYKI